jgi:hypothetical protein
MSAVRGRQENDFLQIDFKSKALVNLCAPKTAVTNGLFHRGGASSSFHTAKTHFGHRRDQKSKALRTWNSVLKHRPLLSWNRAVYKR